MLNRIVRNRTVYHLTVCINKIIYLIYMYKQDLGLNNQQWLRYAMKPNQSEKYMKATFCHHHYSSSYRPIDKILRRTIIWWQDSEVMAIKGYSTIPRNSEQEPYHQMQFNVIHRTPFFWWGLILNQGHLRRKCISYCHIAINLSKLMNAILASICSFIHIVK